MSELGKSATYAPADWCILVHGGAGDVDVERRPLHAEGALRAAKVGALVLEGGGTAVDAVEAAARALEDDPLFNAGRGACLNRDGQIELDAALMSGDRLTAGAVASLPPFANPISVARAVMERTPHALLVGAAAAAWAERHGFAPSTLEALRTDAALARWQAVRAGAAESAWAGGTIGAVARDRAGHVAAATSTGGTVGKLPGRVGDSPILGAGTYADDALGACSGTGHGESYMKYLLALRALDAARAASGGADDAGARVLGELVSMRARIGGTGGAIIALPDGRAAWARTTATMSFGLVASRGGSRQELAGA
jgi:beta-aspartyl-peptidase (threonine type)